MPCKIPKDGNNRNKNHNKNDKSKIDNSPNHKKWIKEFEDLCDENEILQLMIDQAIIYETHPYNSTFHQTLNDFNNNNNNNNDTKLDDNDDDDDTEILNNSNDDILSSNKSHKHNKAMSIKTVISFVGIFLDGIVVLNKLFIKYKQYNQINVDKNENYIGRYCSVKDNKLMTKHETKQIYGAIQQYIIDILKYWIDQYWQFHFINNNEATQLLIYLYKYVYNENSYFQVQHRKDLIQIIEYKYKFNNNNNNNNNNNIRIKTSHLNSNNYDINTTIEFLINTDLHKFVTQKSMIDNELFQSTNFHEWILWGIAYPKFMAQNIVSNGSNLDCIYKQCYKFRQNKCKNIIKLFNEYDLFIRWIQFVIYSAYKRHLDCLAVSDDDDDSNNSNNNNNNNNNSYFQFACLISIFVEMGINFDELHNYHSLSAVYYALNTNPIKNIIESQKPFIMNALCNCNIDDSNYKIHDISTCQGRNCDEQFEMVRKRWDHIYDPNALYSNFRQSQKSLWKSTTIITKNNIKNNYNKKQNENAPYFVPYFTLIFASIVEYYEHYLHSQWNYIKQLNLLKYNNNIHMFQYLKYSLLNQNYILQNNKINNNKLILMKLSKYKSSSEQCLRLMINLHCKISRLFDRCGKTRKKYAISDISNSEEDNDQNIKNIHHDDNYDLNAFLQTQFHQMLIK